MVELAALFKAVIAVPLVDITAGMAAAATSKMVVVPALGSVPAEARRALPPMTLRTVGLAVQMSRGPAIQDVVAMLVPIKVAQPFVEVPALATLKVPAELPLALALDAEPDGTGGEVQVEEEDAAVLETEVLVLVLA